MESVDPRSFACSATPSIGILAPVTIVPALETALRSRAGGAAKARDACWLGNAPPSPVTSFPTCTSVRRSAATAVICAARIRIRPAKNGISPPFGAGTFSRKRLTILCSNAGSALSCARVFSSSWCMVFSSCCKARHESQAARCCASAVRSSLESWSCTSAASQLSISSWMLSLGIGATPLWRGPGEGAGAWRPSRGRECRAAPRCSGRACARSTRNPSLRNSAG